jgi:transposase, IS30 family
MTRPCCDDRRNPPVITVGPLDVIIPNPHAPWQRPTNENTNGLLRAYFPKGTDLSVHSADDIARVEAELNLRPRKVLGWDSPADRMAALLAPPGPQRP